MTLLLAYLAIATVLAGALWVSGAGSAAWCALLGAVWPVVLVLAVAWWLE